MSRACLPLFLLALPLIEIAGFVVVGREIGALATVGLVLLSAVIGAVLMRFQGFGVMARIRSDIAAGKSPGRELAHGLMIMIAGVLLLVPGFVTDILGLLLFIPPVREFGWRLIRDRVTARGGFAGFSTGFSRSPRGSGQTIDLDSGEYSPTGKPGPSPWRPIDRQR